MELCASPARVGPRLLISRLIQHPLGPSHRAVEQRLPQRFERAIPIDVAIQHDAVHANEPRYLTRVALAVGHRGHGNPELGLRHLAASAALPQCSIANITPTSVTSPTINARRAAVRTR